MSTTEIMICFDTEDFTSCRAADAIRDTALLLTDEGIRANYMLVGLLAKQLVQWRRFDVLDALKNHEIQSHSKGHSYHPTICEYTDIADAEQAIALALREESECMGMIRAATGADKIWAGVPAGSNKSDSAMYAYGMLGLDAYCDTYVGLPDGGPVWCCGLLQIPYVCAFENICYRNSDADNDALIEQLAKRKRAIIYNHPNMITHSNFWDKVNYDGENKHEWGKWEEAPGRPAHETIRFYERMREFIYKLKEAKNEDGTPKFVFRTISEVVQAEKRTRTVRRADLPKYLDVLKKAYAEDNFTPLTLSHADAEPISLSECLYAARQFILDSKLEEVSLDNVVCRGFASEPVGITVEASLTLDEVSRVLKTLDCTKYLPAYLPCGHWKTGMADMLCAALEFICDPTLLSVKVTPKPQQPSLDCMPALRDMKLDGTWVYMKEFKDEYVSDRLRLQAWTIHE